MGIATLAPRSHVDPYFTSGYVLGAQYLAQARSTCPLVLLEASWWNHAEVWRWLRFWRVVGVGWSLYFLVLQSRCQCLFLLVGMRLFSTACVDDFPPDHDELQCVSTLMGSFFVNIKTWSSIALKLLVGRSESESTGYGWATTLSLGTLPSIAFLNWHHPAEGHYLSIE
ncbi:unnamed protein product [Ostreobium quekettii]|uniref:Uncharacterized protein n=1 Tax=Ostreobium quekettii TaxID=121088 RepID=A0A8S1J834_9CHLO|nr:unnamed protein product [Ostreobium quekettii]